jgi:hypothetical protein
MQKQPNYQNSIQISSKEENKLKKFKNVKSQWTALNETLLNIKGTRQ